MTTTVDDPTRHDDQAEGVSARTAATLRHAMDRLLAGRPQRTDGRLTKDNLWKEAEVSRATMNRARQVLAEWDSRVAACGGMTPGEARKHDELAKLRNTLSDKTRECTELHHQLDAAATAIAALHHDNTLMRQELSRSGGVVVSLDTRSGTVDQLNRLCESCSGEGCQPQRDDRRQRSVNPGHRERASCTLAKQDCRSCNRRPFRELSRCAS